MISGYDYDYDYIYIYIYIYERARGFGPVVRSVLAGRRNSWTRRRRPAAHKELLFLVGASEGPFPPALHNGRHQVAGLAAVVSPHR